MSELPKILICDDDAIFHLRLKQELNGTFECLSAYDGDEALLILRKQSISLILLDIKMRRANEGLEYIPKLLECDPDLAVVINSMKTDFQTVKNAIQLGAVDYITKDFSREELIHTIHHALTHQKLVCRQKQQNFENHVLQKQHVLIGQSPSMMSLQRQIQKVRSSFANVVITGETGSGKEVVARQLRKETSQHAFEPFLAVDSGTIQSSMAESILFGHEKGAFTGADRMNKGIFEEANGGVVYFDEISNMPLNIQAKLLRVLQEKEISRIGSSKVLKLEFRVICATNIDLEQMCERGEFKQDLLQRLNVIPLHIPPLRERKEDIPALIAHYSLKQNYRRVPIQFSSRALEALKAYLWPGNIRELSNLVTHLSTLQDGNEIDLEDLPSKILKTLENTLPCFSKNHEANSMESESFYQKVMSFEKELLIREYHQESGNISRLATKLGMDRSHLYTKLKTYQIHPTSPSSKH